MGKMFKETNRFLKQVHNLDMVGEVLTLRVPYNCEISIAPITPVRKYIV